MDDAEVFREAFAGVGGRVDLKELSPATAEAFEYQMGRARGFLQTAAKALPKLPPIYFDFFNASAFNARACCRRGRYMIGVSRGAIGTLAFIFDRMLADPRILPFIGDTSLEDPSTPHIPALGSDYTQSVKSVPEFSPPRDPVRYNYAKKLGELAFDFLIAHEFAHIANGHLGHEFATRGIGFIDEMGASASASGGPNPAEAALISQTEEMDADATAVRISLGSEWGKIVGSIPRPGGFWAGHYDYPGQVSLLWSYAVSSLCRIFGDARLTTRDPTTETHPRWRLRSFMIQQETRRVSRPEGLRSHPSITSEGPEGVLMTFMAACRDVEMIFHTMTGLPQEKEGFEEAWGEIGIAQMQRLRDYWRKQLRGELSNHAYHELDSYE
jgi:hypothetical protein